MALPLFALNLALVNDYIPKEKFVAAIIINIIIVYSIIEELKYAILESLVENPEVAIVVKE